MATTDIGAGNLLRECNTGRTEISDLAGQTLGNTSTMDALRRSAWAALLVAGSLAMAGCGKSAADIEKESALEKRGAFPALKLSPAGHSLSEIKVTENGKTFQGEVMIPNIERVTMRDIGQYVVMENRGGELIPHDLYSYGGLKRATGMNWVTQGMTLDAKVLKDAPEGKPMFATLKFSTVNNDDPKLDKVRIELVIHVHKASEIAAANFETPRQIAVRSGKSTSYKTVWDKHTQTVVE